MDLSKIKDMISKMNTLGIPLPVIRDPKTGVGSITATLVFLSFNTALLGQIGKVSKVLGDVDLSQANVLFGVALAAYLGRKMQSDGVKKTIVMEKEEGQ
jgi:hypothetical protein